MKTGGSRDHITRRDFMGGVALSLAAGSMISPLQSFGMTPTIQPPASSSGIFPYPPSLTGLRGNHPGSFEVAHALSWEGKSWPEPDEITDDLYDLLVVGGGLSGLASAHLFQQRKPGARILILENHDDFGGHAKRNEFTIGNRQLIGYGGSQSIDGPSNFSAESKQILQDIGVDVAKFYRYFDRDFYQERQMRPAIFFDKANYGKNQLHDHLDMARDDTVEQLITRYPLSDEGRKALLRLWAGEEDYLPGRPMGEKITFLRGISYDDFLRRHAHMPEEVIGLLRNSVIGLWGLGFDALSALEAYRLEGLGFEGLKLDPEKVPHLEMREEPYIFHFPDGNAGLARLLVQKLIPESVRGGSMEELVQANFDFDKLDHPENNIRIRLLSTVIKAVERGEENAVEVTYVKGDDVAKVRGRHVIMACNNDILPHICPDMPKDQAEALKFPQKVPLSYINVALTNWRAFHKAGHHYFYCPKAFFPSLSLDFPVSMGGYKFSANPDQPILLHVVHVPVRQGEGLSAREQHRLGRHDIYNMTFADYEEKLMGQLQDMLGPFGFEAQRDISAITVNRWPHGYAYEYNELWEPWGWVDETEEAPHIIGRKQMGRISIANSDSEAFAYVNGAFDAASRAVKEQLE